MKDNIAKAVALKYKQMQNVAPEISAKGVDSLAEKIIQIAKENGIPIVENSILVNLLMDIEIGNEIPEELYRAVAEIYKFIWELSNKKATNL